MNRSAPEIATNLQIVSVVPSRQSAKSRLRKAEDMEDYVGEEYDAVVSSIVSFCRIAKYSRRLDYITNLPEFYHFNERFDSSWREIRGQPSVWDNRFVFVSKEPIK